MIKRRAFLMAGVGASLVLAGCSGGDEATDSQGTVALDELMREGPLPEMAKGDPNAPVTIVEYASMTCGFCRRFHLETYDTIVEQYVDTGRVRFVVREFPFDPRAAAAAMLIRCTPEPQRDAMTDALYERQPDWSRADNAQAALFDIVRLAGFTEERFKECLTDQELLEKITSVQKRGSELGVESTPTFFVNGAKYSGHKTVEEMSEIIEAAI